MEVKPKDPAVTSESANQRVVKAGIKVDGKLSRSAQWIMERISFLQEKIAEYEVRAKNAKAEIEQRTSELQTVKGREVVHG